MPRLTEWGTIHWIACIGACPETGRRAVVPKRQYKQRRSPAEGLDDWHRKQIGLARRHGKTPKLKLLQELSRRLRDKPGEWSSSYSARLTIVCLAQRAKSNFELLFAKIWLALVVAI
jgi:hypothetical protein